jgi:uncharacterized protein (TIGR02569 family)
VSPPPPEVLAAFGVAGSSPVPLSGGMGTSWRAAGLVLKPADADVAELDWQADLYAGLTGDGFRLARPRRAAGGSVCAHGWSAAEFVPGGHEPGRWADIIAVGERFHAALRAVPRPGFLAARSTPWAVSDRVAWGEAPLAVIPDQRYLAQLAAAARPVTAASQVVHGDLTGNVLFHDRLPPAIIDLAPYWRPPGYASAVVVADALLFEGADESILRAVGHVADFGQYLIRALSFRIAADQLVFDGRPPDPRWAATVDLACQLARAG